MNLSNRLPRTCKNDMSGTDSGQFVSALGLSPLECTKTNSTFYSSLLLNVFLFFCVDLSFPLVKM